MEIQQEIQEIPEITQEPEQDIHQEIYNLLQDYITQQQYYTPIQEEVFTPNGTFTFIKSMTIGDALITLSILLLLAFFVLRWLLDTVWRGGR